MADTPTPRPLTADALDELGLLRSEYPDDMARRSCTCTDESICGAHRLLARYEALYQSFKEANAEKRRQRKRAMDAEAEVDRLTANLAHTTSQRDAADACIWRIDEGWQPCPDEGAWRTHFFTQVAPKLVADRKDEPMTSYEAEALRRARAAQPQEGP